MIDVNQKMKNRQNFPKYKKEASTKNRNGKIN